MGSKLPAKDGAESMQLQLQLSILWLLSLYDASNSTS